MGPGALGKGEFFAEGLLKGWVGGWVGGRMGRWRKRRRFE